MSLIQAVKNSIIHGNHSNPEKKVTVTADLYKGGIYFMVADEGEGFDVGSYGDVLEGEARGTGIYLMTVLSDNIVFLDNGTKVRMDFAISGIEPGRALERKMTLHGFYSSKGVFV